MADTTYSFIHKGWTQLVFSDESDLNLVASDMGEAMVSIAPDGEASTRVNTATGNIPSAMLTQPYTITIAIAKTSASDSLYRQKVVSNSILEGTLTIYDDSNKSFVYTSLSLSGGDTENYNGTEAHRIYIIKCLRTVNEDLIAELS